MADQRRYWVFQGNPKLYDVAGAVEALNRIDWSARQGADRMQIGDRVFLWETGTDSRLVGIGSIVSGLHDGAEKASAEALFTKTYAADEDRSFIGVGQIRAIDPPVRRDQLKQHPLLRCSGYMKNNRGTNFELRKAEGLALEAIIRGHLTPRVVKIAPGTGAHLWEQCRKEQSISVGWDEVPDLRGFETEDAFKVAFAEAYPNYKAGNITLKGRELWTLRELVPGDIVVANKGISRVLAIGVVKAPAYEYKAELGEYPHAVRVDWDTSYETEHHRQYWAFKTLADIDEEEIAQILSGGAQPPDKPAPTLKNKKRKTSGTSEVATLLDALVARGLYFPADLVSAYLLALQTRRFVLLTGISGTGKTALAHAVADWFAPEVEAPLAADDEEQAALLTTQPYMIKYSRFIVPAGLRTGYSLPQEDGDGRRRLLVRFPGGKARLTLGAEPDRNVVEILLKGDAKDWFKSHLAPGDPFEIQILVSDDDRIEQVDLRLPVKSSVKSKLENAVTVAVRPDWTDSRGLLGYYNPLTRQYVPTPFLRLLIRAGQEVERAAAEGRTPVPFFAILDEMNLARVEHYFSDFLSCMESGKGIHLHDDPLIERGETDLSETIPCILTIPQNLYLTGTVNVDETTYMFSPKVLDRAFTLELNRVDLGAFGTTDGMAAETALVLSAIPPGLPPASKPSAGDWKQFKALYDGVLADTVTEMHDRLAGRDRHFGYRVAAEIARFVLLAASQAGESAGSLWSALDVALKAKVLAKLHGTRQELEGLLRDLLEVAENVEQLPLTADKVQRMLRRAERQGFTSFIE